MPTRGMVLDSIRERVGTKGGWTLVGTLGPVHAPKVGGSSSNPSRPSRRRRWTEELSHFPHPPTSVVPRSSTLSTPL
jgi:hypothetical protein